MRVDGEDLRSVECVFVEMLSQMMIGLVKNRLVPTVCAVVLLFLASSAEAGLIVSDASADATGPELRAISTTQTSPDRSPTAVDDNRLGTCDPSGTTTSSPTVTVTSSAGSPAMLGSRLGVCKPELVARTTATVILSLPKPPQLGLIRPPRCL